MKGHQRRHVAGHARQTAPLQHVGHGAQPLLQTDETKANTHKNSVKLGTKTVGRPLADPAIRFRIETIRQYIVFGLFPEIQLRVSPVEAHTQTERAREREKEREGKRADAIQSLLLRQQAKTTRYMQTTRYAVEQYANGGRVCQWP